jgi:hypothetical protein
MNQATHDSLLVAAKRYQSAVEAVFLKWDADAMGRFDGTATNCFCTEDLNCACCAQHRELRDAHADLARFTQYVTVVLDA